MDIDTIITAYLDNRSNKRRSQDSAIFELHWERDLVRLLDDINDRSLDPFIYSFVRTKPRPREVIAALMQTKIPQHYFDRIVRPLVEARPTKPFVGGRANCRMHVKINRKNTRLSKTVETMVPAFIFFFFIFFLLKFKY